MPSLDERRAAHRPSISDAELVTKVGRRYRADPVPPCRVCGGALSVQCVGGGAATVWACSGFVDDPLVPGERVRAPGRSLGDDHYGNSRWTQYQEGDGEVVELARRFTELLSKAQSPADALAAAHAQEAARPTALSDTLPQPLAPVKEALPGGTVRVVAYAEGIDGVDPGVLARWLQEKLVGALSVLPSPATVEVSGARTVADGLLPCPFCGGDAVASIYPDESLYSHATVNYLQISCGACEASMRSCEDFDEVIAAWNSRPAPAPVPPAGDAAPMEFRTFITANQQVAFSIGVQSFTLDYDPQELPDCPREQQIESMRQWLELALSRLAGRRAAPLVTKADTCEWCHDCRPITLDDMRMILCPICGNKRCPHANDHRNECTGSNEPGQPGSAYAHVYLTPAQRRGLCVTRPVHIPGATPESK